MTGTKRLLVRAKKNSESTEGPFNAFPRALSIAALMLMSQAALAQRSSEDAVAEALDAFGTGVGRETIGLYSAGNARGFSPIQAGNLRIEGLYFNTIGGFPFSFLPKPYPIQIYRL